MATKKQKLLDQEVAEKKRRASEKRKATNERKKKEKEAREKESKAELDKMGVCWKNIVLLLMNGICVTQGSDPELGRGIP